MREYVHSLMFIKINGQKKQEKNMAGYLTIQIYTPSKSVEDLSLILRNGDDTNGHEIATNIGNFLSGINGGIFAGSIVAYSSDVAGTVSGQTGGVNAVVNLL